MKLSEISLKDLIAIQEKMHFFDMTEGWIGLEKKQVRLFLKPCSNAKTFITYSQVVDAINNYNAE